MHLRLRSSMVLVVVVGLTIPVSVSSFLTIGQREQELNERMRSDQERMTSILAYGMLEPLWDINPKSGLPVLESVLGDKRIVAITVRDNRNRIFLAKEHPERREGRRLLLTRNVVYNGDPIGSVSVEMDSGRMDSEVASSRRLFAWTAVAQLMLSLVLIVTLLQLRILVPIRRLMHESGRLAKRDLGSPFVWEPTDELGSLGASLEHTRQALQGLFSEIESKNQMLEKDIEQRALTTKELQRHRENLEELVKERTAELQIAKERADVANLAKGTFLSNMTHELRTPLNAILGYAQILQRDRGLSERQATGLTTIEKSGQHLLMLITDLLDLAKIEAGKFELMTGPVNLSAFLAGVVDIVRVKADQKNIPFRLETGVDLPETVLIDEKRLRQILLNLLGNAVKFTDHGHISLNIQNSGQEPGKVRLHFEIGDTGVGMAQSQLSHIFQPFEQVGDVQRKFGGTGLGLSISQQLVRLMDSEIHVKSECGVGSIFSFDIDVPVRVDTVEVMASERAMVGYRGARKKILIVDDVAENRDLLMDLLGSIGFEICVAANGLEGIEQAIANRPDIVLMDVVMPVMNGLDATRRIRQDPDLRDIAIIAISASTAKADQEKALTAGVDAFMSKPVQQNFLLAKIAEFLKLTLIFDTPLDSASGGIIVNAAEIVAPPRDEIVTLHRIAVEGNMGEIRQRADMIELLAPQYKPFADKLRYLAKSYQSKAILKMVAEHLGQRGPE